MVAMPRRQTLLLGGWAVHLILTPFYVFESGNPQPADILMAVLVVCVLSGLFMRLPRINDLYICIGFFLLIVVNINLFWWTLYLDPFFLKSSLFYIYNAAIMVAVVAMYAAGDPDAVSRFTARGILLAAIVELIAAIALPDLRGSREVGTFNNPNQLGYWSLLTAACWLVVRDGRRLDWSDVALLAALGYLTTLSLSKAAMGGFGLLVLFAAGAQGLRGRLATGAIAVMLLTLPILIMEPKLLRDRTTDFFSDGTAALVVERLDSIGKQQDDSVAGRGYDRLWTYPGYLFFGAGEGAYERFEATGKDMELHSTWGTVLFCYGIAGLLALFSILWTAFRYAPWRHLLYFVPVALYGLTHQGLRFSLFWIFCGLVLGVSRYRGIARAPSMPAADVASDWGEAEPARLRGPSYHAAVRRERLGRAPGGAL